MIFIRLAGPAQSVAQHVAGVLEGGTSLLTALAQPVTKALQGETSQLTALVSAAAAQFKAAPPTLPPGPHR